jgi:hypothetical protein
LRAARAGRVRLITDCRTAAPRAAARRSAEADEQVGIRDPGRIDEDDAKAAEGRKPSPGVAESYRKANERGARAKGEGRIP